MHRGQPIVTQKQLVPSAQNIHTAKLSSIPCKSCFSSLVILNSRHTVHSQRLPILNLRRTKVPTLSKVDIAEVINITRHGLKAFFYSGVSGASQKPQAAAVPTQSMLNRFSSFFGWTETAPSAPPIDKRIQATGKPKQGTRSPQLSFPIFDSIH